MSEPKPEWVATDLDLRWNELLNARAETHPGAPANPVKGQLWFDDAPGVQTLKWYDGTTWSSGKSYYDVVADDGTDMPSRRKLNFRSTGGVAAEVRDEGPSETSSVLMTPVYGPVVHSQSPGQDSDDGTSEAVARADHVHGTPPSGGSDLVMTSWWQSDEQLWEQLNPVATFLEQISSQTVGGGWRLEAPGSIYWTGQPIPIDDSSVYRNTVRISAPEGNAKFSMGWLCYDALGVQLGSVRCTNAFPVPTGTEAGSLVARNLILNPSAEGSAGSELVPIVYDGSEDFLPSGGSWNADTDVFTNTLQNLEQNMLVNPNMDDYAISDSQALVTNLITNPGFDVSTANWTVANGTLARSTTKPYSGTGHAAITANSTTGPTITTVITGITPGVCYRMIAAVCAGNGGAFNDKMNARLVFRNGAGTALLTVAGTPTFGMLTDPYGSVETQATAPAGAVDVQVQIFVTAGTASGDIYFVDCVQLWDVTQWQATSWYPLMAQDARFTLAFTGTAGLSTSILSGPPIAAANLVKNPSFEGSIGVSSWLALGATMTQDTTQADSGGACAKYVSAGSGSGGAIYLSRPVIPGRRYRITSRVKLAAGSSASLVNVHIDWLDAAQVFLSSEGAPNGALTPGVWTTLTYVGTAPATAVYANVVALAEGGPIASGTTIAIDSVIFALDDNHHMGTDPVYFDGSFTGQQMNGNIGDPDPYIWAGAANDSTSLALRTKPVAWDPNVLFGGASSSLPRQTRQRYVTPSTGNLVNQPGSTPVGDSVRALRVDLPTDTKPCGIWQVAPLVVDQLYTFSCWLYVPSGSPDVRIGGAFSDQTALITAKDQWVYREIDFKSPSNGFFVGVTATGPTTAGQYFLVDAARLVDRVGLGRASDFEHGVDDWFSTPAFGAMEVATYAATDERKHVETKSLKVYWPTSYGAATSGSGVYTQMPEGAVQGKKYTFSCWVYVPSGSPDVVLDSLYAAAGERCSIKDQWVRLSMTYIHTIVNQNIIVGVRTPDKSVLGGNVFIDTPRFDVGPTTLDYFDGDSGAPSHDSFYWNGVPDKSSSGYKIIEEGFLAAPIFGYLNKLTAKWQVSVVAGSTDPVTVWPGAVGGQGKTVLTRGMPVTIIPGVSQQVTWTMPSPGWAAWRPALWIGPKGAHVNLTVEYSADESWHSDTTGGTSAFASFEYANDRVSSGLRSVKITWPGLSTGTTSSNVVTPTAANMDHEIPPGTLVTFSARIYVPTGSPDVMLTVLGQGRGAPITTKNQWVWAEYSFTTPMSGGAGPYECGVVCATPNVGTICYIDDAMFKMSGALPGGLKYFDGDTPNTADAVYTWEGDPSGSPSAYHTVAASWVNVSGFIADGGSSTPAVGATSSVDTAVDPPEGTMYFRPFIASDDWHLVVDTHEVARTPRHLLVADGVDAGWVDSEGPVTAPVVYTKEIVGPSAGVKIGPVVDPPAGARDAVPASYLKKMLGLPADGAAAAGPAPPQFLWSGLSDPSPADAGFPFAAWPLFSTWFDSSVVQTKIAVMDAGAPATAVATPLASGVWLPITNSAAVVFTPPVDGIVLGLSQGSAYASWNDYLAMRCTIYSGVDENGAGGALFLAGSMPIVYVSGDAGNPTNLSRLPYMVMASAAVTGGVRYKMVTEYNHGGGTSQAVGDHIYALYIPGGVKLP